MSIRCSKCGEELLGAVNRCWRCGTTFRAAAAAGGLPPVRRSPVAIVDAEIVQTPADVATAIPVSGEPVAISPPVASQPTSPFAEGAVVVDRRHTVAIPRRQTAAVGGAIASVLLGVVSLLSAKLLPLGSLITCVIGLPFGVWGIYSERRGLAIVGLALCCLALGLASFFGAVELYVWTHGHSPWDIQPMPENPF